MSPAAVIIDVQTLATDRQRGRERGREREREREREGGRGRERVRGRERERERGGGRERERESEGRERERERERKGERALESVKRKDVGSDPDTLLTPFMQRLASQTNPYCLLSVRAASFPLLLLFCNIILTQYCGA